MPIKIDNNLPAAATLAAENIFVIPENRAIHQDIRPLKIAILNLMPTKIVTETQLLRLLGNTPLQVDITLLHPATHTSKNTSADHLLRFYKTFDEVKHEKFDGMIITGAPVEEMPFEEVTYWEELCQIMEWTKTHVYSTYHICWGAQAGLYYHYGVPKHQLPQKAFGIFPHTLKGKYVPLFRGFDDTFYVPHSRHTGVHRSDVAAANPDLIIMADSPEAGLYIAMTRDGRQIFATGHAEYDPNTLQLEYERDKAKGLDIQIPAHYFPNDDPTQEPLVRWRGHANLLFSNWLNYYVYQATPFDVEAIH